MIYYVYIYFCYNYFCYNYFNQITIIIIYIIINTNIIMQVKKICT